VPAAAAAVDDDGGEEDQLGAAAAELHHQHQHLSATAHSPHQQHLTWTGKFGCPNYKMVALNVGREEEGHPHPPTNQATLQPNPLLTPLHLLRSRIR